MAEEDSAGSHQTASNLSNQEIELLIPSHLKFLISNITNLVPTLLTSENSHLKTMLSGGYNSIYTSPQNGYGEHLTGQTICPPESTASEHNRWKLIDRNLVSALLSMISSSILPYNTSHDVWLTLERRLQPTNRSRVIQLKNELHQIQMKDRTMQQYLDQLVRKLSQTDS